MGKQYEFQKLTPIDDVNMGIYSNAMEYVFANKDIRNIAISGSYGAGKSSMIESYKKQNPDKKFIHISLAHFIQEDGDGNGEMVNVNELEGKIINQLIHQIDPGKIPQTSFRVKRNVDSKKIGTISILVTLFIAIACMIRYKSAWDNMVQGFSIDLFRHLLAFTTTKESLFVLGLLALVILGVAIYQLILLQQRTKMIKSLNVQGNQIDVFEETKDSYFDKYLNEILYIFEQSEMHGIIFEDIDRYNNNLIFGKLREINYLLNSRCKDTESIRFFYLIKDDIFVSKDRTKFFDFIIPIVPVVDGSNSYEKFIEYFKSASLLQLFDKYFLYDLSLYVDDMRVLKNICNEFVVYSEKLESSATEQDPNKLLAMITYKNLFPKDFGELQIGKGYVHTVFDNVDDYKKSQIEKLEAEISVLQEENQKIDSEMCKNIEELNALYFSISGRIRVNNKEEKFFASRVDFVREVLEGKGVQRAEHVGYSVSWNPINIENEKKTMEENPEYIKRKELVTQKCNQVVQKNNKSIAVLKSKIEKISKDYLKNVITRENEEEVFGAKYENDIDDSIEFNNVKGSSSFDLIKYLICEGYIDETYPDYMTYFYANSISNNDKIFLRSIVSKKAKAYDHRIDNPEEVIARIRLSDFKEEEILNFDLLKYLLSNEDKYKEQIKGVMYTIWNLEPLDFVVGFMGMNVYRKDFVRGLSEYWDKSCSWIITSNEVQLDVKRQFMWDVLCICTGDVLEANNKWGEINQFIEGDAGFLAVDEDVDINKILLELRKLGIKFWNIDTSVTNQEVLKFVYENDMYRIKMEIVEKWLNCFYGIFEGDIQAKSLTLIMTKREEPLCEYVLNNINEYILEQLSVTEDNYEVLETVEFVLNCEEIAAENKERYISTIRKPIKCIRNIRDIKLWQVMLEKDIVEKNLNNLCDYYFASGNGLDDALVTFINGFGKDISFEGYELNKIYADKSMGDLWESLIGCNQIENAIYGNIVASAGYILTDFEELQIDEDKIDILLENKVLEMNQTILLQMRTMYPEKVMGFILQNSREYAEIMDEDIYYREEILDLLEQNVDEQIKLKLLQYETEPISVREAKYSPKVEEYIVGNLYSEEDFEYLLKGYTEKSFALKKLILDIAIESVEEITFLLHKQLLLDMIACEQMDEEDENTLLFEQIGYGLSKKDARIIFQKVIGAEPYLLLLKGISQKIEVSDLRKRMLDKMLERGWIEGYNIDEDDEDYYQVIAKKVTRIISAHKGIKRELVAASVPEDE